MAIVDKLNQLQADIRDAYDSVTEKGGVVPVHQNTHNIAEAIDSIPTTPTFTSNGFANDSWETIIAIAEAGLAQEYYQAGDTKDIVLSSVTDTTGEGKNIVGKTYHAVIVGFNKMNKTNGGKGNMTIMLTSTTAQTQNVDWEVRLPRSYYSWAGAGRLQNWLNITVKASLPAILQSHLVQCKQKYYNNYSRQIIDLNSYVTIPNAYNFGVDYLSDFSGVNGSETAIRDLQTEHTFDYFADFKNRQDGIFYQLGNSGWIGYLTADTTSNWFYLYINYKLNDFQTLDSSSNTEHSCHVSPIFTIG